MFSTLATAPVAPILASKAAEIDNLTASGDPHDAFKAFSLAMTCKLTRYSYRYGPIHSSEKDVATYCGDITELQLRELEKNMNKAVAADVPDALIGKLYYGARGISNANDELHSTDPVVIEWRQAMLRDLDAYVLRTGDTTAMVELANLYFLGGFDIKNVELAFAYLIAAERLNARSVDPRHRRIAKAYPASSSYMAKELTAEQIANAQAIASQFLVNCCKKR